MKKLRASEELSANSIFKQNLSTCDCFQTTQNPCENHLIIFEIVRIAVIINIFTSQTPKDSIACWTKFFEVKLTIIRKA